jgi:hypothetical protein
MKTFIFAILSFAVSVAIAKGPAVAALQNGQSNPSGIGDGSGMGRVHRIAGTSKETLFAELEAMCPLPD